ncbi:flagellar hook-associated protein FlgK [Spirochaeta lutea]|uniref:Flagellar hook-associated protein 1 n=1 Tax=Spirochaeta lutea TaxID=1480694 RepID=A0A098R1K4_9SPIO|nr:flagellar hook-associated protein FlgK [Spirochaeta lutea]KGE73563.1 flagellar hook protein FlgK [Spirochaeta lutea]
MQSTFSGIEIGKRSLLTHNQGLQTIGHNLSNASTQGYSRQRVELGTVDPLYRPQLNRAMTPGQIGQGVETTRISRVKDMLLEGRIVANAADEGYWSQRDKYVLQLEQIYNEPSESSVRNLMDKFWDGWQELSIYPEQMSARQQVAQRGEALAEGIQNRYNSLNQLRSVLNDEVHVEVSRINTLTDQISDLNAEIAKVQAEGDEPNDLLDKRDLLVEELSGIIPVTIETKDPDEYSIYTNGIHLVQGAISRTFSTQTDPQNDGYSMVVWADSGAEFRPESGSLGAHIELRDQDICQEIQNLDNLAVNMADIVNEVHSVGFGINGRTGEEFFEHHPMVTNTQGNYDRSGDGVVDSSYIFRIGGTNQLTAQDQIGLEGTISLSGPNGLVEVPYRSDDTVQDVLVRINNSGAEVVARLDFQNKLTLKGAPSQNKDNPDFVIREVSDSGQFLAGYAGLLLESGDAGAYRWDQPDAITSLRAGADFAVAPLSHASAWLSVNPEILEDPASIATSLAVQNRPGDVGDGRVALEIASIRNSPVMVGQISTFDDYFADSVASVGLKGQQAQSALRTQEAIMKDLRDLRSSISGVSIDEELAQMIKFQHGYNAAARFVTKIDQMLETIINRLGV